MKNTTSIRIKPENAPPEKQIIFCISLYFSIPPVFSRQNFYFKNYLDQIAAKRNFIESISDATEKKVFKMYLTSRKPKIKISLEFTNKCHSGQYLINKNLKKFVSEIMTDFESGILKVQPYKKPPTKTELNKKINEFYQNRGIPVKIPLREPTLKERAKAFKQKSVEIDQQNTL